MGTIKEATTAFISKSIPELTKSRSKSVPAGCNENDIKWELNNKKLECENAKSLIGELQNKIENLRIEWRSQQEHLGKLHQDFTKLQHTLGEHSIYCATLGATMGSLLWKVSRMEGTIESILESNRINQMILIMDNSLKAFIEVFGHDIPDPYGNEYQFVLSWMGILTNISACPDGRYFLLSKCEGSQLIIRLIEVIPKFSHPNGILLQRMILMILYNLMINTNGVLFMQKYPNLTTILKTTLTDNKKETEIQDLIFKVLCTLTQNIQSVNYLNHLKQTLPWAFIDSIAQNNLSPSQEMAVKIKNNIKNVENNFEMENIWNNRPEELVESISVSLAASSKSNTTPYSDSSSHISRKKTPPKKKTTNSRSAHRKYPQKYQQHQFKYPDQPTIDYNWHKTIPPVIVQNDQCKNMGIFKPTTNTIGEMLECTKCHMFPCQCENISITKETSKSTTPNINLNNDTNPTSIKPSKDSITDSNAKTEPILEQNVDTKCPCTPIEITNSKHSDTNIPLQQPTIKPSILHDESSGKQLQSILTELSIKHAEEHSDLDNAVDKCISKLDNNLDNDSNEHCLLMDNKKRKYHCKHLCSKSCRIFD